MFNLLKHNRRRYRIFNGRSFLWAILSLICLMLYVLPLRHLGDVRLGLEYLPTLCFGVTSQKKTLHFQTNLNNPGRNKRILLWTYMWSLRSWNKSLGQETFSQCPEKRCELEVDRCLQPISDAVLLHWPTFFINTPNSLPDNHPPWQTWVVGVYESEANYQNPMNGFASELDGKINWIISHRFDSDVFMPYNFFLKILDNPKRLQPIIPQNMTISALSLTLKVQDQMKNYDPVSSADTFTVPALPNTNYAKSKTKLALWFVSNCHTAWSHKRMELLEELRKYLRIDVFGNPDSCQSIGAREDPCKRDATCSAHLMSSYKFYLSFENSECNYYITEKFYNPLIIGTVPIAFGAPLKHYEAIAPKDSFLHVSNFTSVKALADYMKYLDENDEQYNRYLKWKDSHVHMRNYNIEEDFYCKLCSDLWKIKTKSKVYHNFSDWWNKDKNCRIGVP